MHCLLAGLALTLIAQPSQNINSYVQNNLNDVTFTWSVNRSDRAELRKINRDFETSYQVAREKPTVYLAQPLRLRIQARTGDTDSIIIVNGATRRFQVPRINVNVRQDLSNEPGKRQTWLDFGLLTPDLFRDLYTAKFVRQDRATGDVVFDLTYQNPRDTTRQRVFIDPKNNFLKRREWYNQQGRLMATFLYENPQTVSGAVIPGRIVVRNADNREAGVSSLSNIRVNTGLAASLFQ
ncbi:MAG: outer membrane lipoprotein-sorting protein [Fimbriimonadaceae bacterium]